MSGRSHRTIAAAPMPETSVREREEADRCGRGPSAGARRRRVVASGSMSLPRRLVLCLVALVVAGCSYVETVPPSPSPADFQGIATEFAKRGIQIDNVVSGDAGCTDTVLAPTARSFDASGLDQATTVRIYLYMFADRATYERLRTDGRRLRRLVRHRSGDLPVGRAVAVRDGRPGAVGPGVRGRPAGRADRRGRLRGQRRVRLPVGRGSAGRSRAAGSGSSPRRSRSAWRRAGSARPGIR